jgi:hypothetical protein
MRKRKEKKIEIREKETARSYETLRLAYLRK